MFGKTAIKKTRVIIGTGFFICVLFSCVEKTEPAVITKITASSTLPDKKNRYQVIHLVDGRRDSSWVEGRQDDGIGEHVTITLSHKAAISGIHITNGYWEEKYYGANNRVRDMTVTGQGGQVLVHTLKDCPEEQTIALEPAWDVQELTFIIESVYPGSKWRDTALSEITLEGIAKTDMSTISAANGPAEEKPIPPAPDAFPLTVPADGFTFTLYADKHVTAEGTGMSQCDQKFVEGTWDYNAEGKKLITYIVLQQPDCFPDGSSGKESDWKEISLETVVD